MLKTVYCRDILNCAIFLLVRRESIAQPIDRELNKYMFTLQKRILNIVQPNMTCNSHLATNLKLARQMSFRS